MIEVRGQNLHDCPQIICLDAMQNIRMYYMPASAK